MALDTRPSERTIGQLVADATHDVQGILRSEIALAKAEVTSGVKVLSKGAGFLGAAAFVGLLGLIFLFHTLVFVLALWLPVWASYLVVTLVLFAVAGICALVGVNRMKAAKPVPQKAIAEAQQTIAVIKP